MVSHMRAGRPSHVAPPLGPQPTECLEHRRSNVAPGRRCPSRPTITWRATDTITACLIG